MSTCASPACSEPAVRLLLSWLALFRLGILLFALAASASAAPAAPMPVTPEASGSQLLQRAAFLLDPPGTTLATSQTPPPEGAAWQPVDLPDLWRVHRPGVRAATGWYRLRFQAAPQAGELFAVYLPKLVLNAAVFLNGVPIGDGGAFEEPVARNWNRPLLFLVPPGLLQPGENTLHIRLRAHDYTQAALHPVWVGPEAALRGKYERAYFLAITLNQTATLLIAAIGALMLSLWSRRRRDTAYGYFGASALVWALQSSNLYIQQPLVDTATWEILANAGFQIFSGFLLISLLRFVEAGGRALVATLWLGVVLAPISLALVSPAQYLGLTALWHLFTLVCAVMTLGLLLRAAFLRGNREARFLVAAMCLVLLFASHDWLIHSQHLWSWRARWPLNDVFLLHYSAPMVYFAIGLIMSGRFVRVLNEFERLNDHLEARAAAKQAELEENHARLRELETERLVAEERERIYRDLHDDVGAKLLSLVYRAGTPENADLARSALQDLRDVVSRSSADSFALEEVVADWRAECEKRLGEAGLNLDWRQRGELATIRLSQPQALNLGRILREAVSNVIRHAGAVAVTVELAYADGRLRLVVSDDGRGCPDEAQRPSGRGLRNMEMRAGRLGGWLRRENNNLGGCRIEVEAPL